MEKPKAFLDDTQHSVRNTNVSHEGKPWPREFLTLTLVFVCVAFWAVVLLAVSTL